MSSPSVSVVVATLNRLELLRALLADLDRQECPRKLFEVVVVDNGSTDGTGAWLRAQSRPDLRVLTEERPGAAAARNAGWRAAHGERILFLDDDMGPEPGVVGCHWEAHRRSPEASFLGHVHNPWRDRPEPFLRYLAERDERDAFPFSDGERTPFTSFFTGHVSVPRGALEALGGFDESFAAYGHEDTELGWRLDRAGVPLIYLAGARAVNRDVPTEAAFWRKTVLAGRAKAQLLRRHPELARVLWRTRLNGPMAPLFGLLHAAYALPVLRRLGSRSGGRGVPLALRWAYRVESRHWHAVGWRGGRAPESTSPGPETAGGEA